jgi:hypothetical protein
MLANSAIDSDTYSVPARVSFCVYSVGMNRLGESGPPADLVKLRSSVRLYVFSGAMYQPTRLSATVYALANIAIAASQFRAGR